MRNFWNPRFLWAQLSDRVLNPHPDEAQVQAHLEQLRQNLPVPVFWLLGKAQSGKSSLVRTLTGRSEAEIGNGFQACTRTARLYDFPDSQHPLLRFLDTRGLGESHYDPGEDLRLFGGQAHVLLLLMKVTDPNQDGVIAALREIRRAHANWPVVLVQTCLHEAYPELGMEHLQPYPYAENPLPNRVPADLRRALHQQREQLAEFGPLPAVAVDFTLPEDGYLPVEYGLPELWTTIEQAFPLGIQKILQDHSGGMNDIYAKAARSHIISYALLAASAEAVPVPWVALPVVLALQAKMLHSIAHIYRQELNSKHLAELGSALGMGYGLRLLGREAIKFIPVYGSAVAAVYAGGVTYALGRMLCLYLGELRQGKVPTPEELKALYEKELGRGKEFLFNYLRNTRQPESKP